MKFITYEDILIALYKGKAYTLFSSCVMSATLDNVLEYIDTLLEDSIDGLWCDTEVSREELRNEIILLEEGNI